MLGFLFKFPVPVLFLLPFIGIALSLATRASQARPLAHVIFVSGFLAQATSIFITPFTWPLRFAFFFVLFGCFVAFIHAQLKHLS